ncbi:MAG: hypothetical protein IJD65_04310, partial [Mailhella sp.]|nr:hypothetical protein [Mailhella sp.]
MMTILFAQVMEHGTVYYGPYNGLQLIPEEHRNYRRGCLVTAETAIVSCGSRRNSEKILII